MRVDALVGTLRFQLLYLVLDPFDRLLVLRVARTALSDLDTRVEQVSLLTTGGEATFCDSFWVS